MGVRGLYRRSFLLENGLLFPEGLFGEDQEWTPKVLAKAQCLASNEEPCYYYREGRAGSLVNTVNVKKAQMLFSTYREWKTLLIDDDRLDEDFREALRREGQRRFVDMVCCFSEESSKEDLPRFCGYVTEYRDLFSLAPGMNRNYDFLAVSVRTLGVNATVRLLRLVLRAARKTSGSAR